MGATDSKLYLTLKSAVKVDVQTLQAEILNLAKNFPLRNIFKTTGNCIPLTMWTTWAQKYRKRRYRGRYRYALPYPQSQDVRLDGAENDGRCERGAKLGGAGGVLSFFFSCKFISILFCCDVFFLTAFEDSVGVPNSSARRRVPQEVQLGARGDVFRDKELVVLRGGRSGGSGGFTSEGNLCCQRCNEFSIFLIS